MTHAGWRVLLPVALAGLSWLGCSSSGSSRERALMTAGGAAGGGGPPSTAGSGGGSSNGVCVPQPIGATSTAKIRTVGYLPTYRGALGTLARQIDWSKLSYVNIAFADVDPRGALSLADQGLCQFTSSAHAAGVKVCVAVGGAATIDSNEGMGKYLPLLAPEGRAGFIEQIRSFLAAHGLDCIDLDFESANLGVDYAGFVASLSSALASDGREVTTAVGRWFGNAQLTAALPHFAFVNVMAYDMCPFWESVPCDHSELDESQNQEMAYWIGQGLPANKAVLGVPFYGYRWRNGNGEALSHADIVSIYGAAADDDWIESGGATVVHNSLATIQAKAALAEQSYGGIMIWELMQDAPPPSSLLDAIDAAL